MTTATSERLLRRCLGSLGSTPGGRHIALTFPILRDLQTSDALVVERCVQRSSGIRNIFHAMLDDA